MYRFLIVDDNENDALQLSFLIVQDYSSEAKCEHAASRSSALSWLDPDKHQPFDAILLDLNLGDSEGVETFRSVRRAVPFTPIVVYSGRDDERGLRDLLIDEGAEGYITKGRVKVVDVFQALYDAARRAKLTSRMSLEEKHVLAEAERRTLDLVRHSRKSDPPESSALLLAEAVAAQARTNNHFYRRLVKLSDRMEDVNDRASEAVDLSDTAKRRTVSLEEATKILDEKHEEFREEHKKLVQTTVELEAKDAELEKMAKDNKRKLAVISSGVAFLGYVFGEHRDIIFTFFKSLLEGG